MLALLAYLIILLLTLFKSRSVLIVCLGDPKSIIVYLEKKQYIEYLPPKHFFFKFKKMYCKIYFNRYIHLCLYVLFLQNCFGTNIKSSSTYAIIQWYKY